MRAGENPDLDAWDAAADAYAEAVGSPGDTITSRFLRFLAAAVGDLAGADVLDLGCGHGWFAGKAAAAGAAVVGVDGSANLLRIAADRHPAIEFELADLNYGLPASLASRRFDVIVALMVLMDLAELDRLLGDVAACLRPSGRFVVTMTHPAFWSHSPATDEQTGERYRRVTGYLQTEERWVSTFGGHRHYHRPLGWYFERLAAHRLAVTSLVEPPTPPPATRPVSETRDYDRWYATIPTMLGLVAQPLADHART